MIRKGKENDEGNDFKTSTIPSVKQHRESSKASHYVKKDSEKEYFREEGFSRGKTHCSYKTGEENHPKNNPASLSLSFDVLK